MTAHFCMELPFSLAGRLLLGGVIIQQRQRRAVYGMLALLLPHSQESEG